MDALLGALTLFIWIAGFVLWLGLAAVTVDAVRCDGIRVMKRLGEWRGQSYWVRATIIVLLVISFPVCVVHKAHGADDVSLLEIAREEARERLVERGYDVANLDMSSIRVLEMRERMACGGARALGCFAEWRVPVGNGERVYGVMAYRRVAPSEGYSYSSLRKVLVHEWTHAFLWALNDPTWDVHDDRFRQ